MDYTTILNQKTTHDKKFQDCGLSTKCLHIGQEPDAVYGGVNVPINLSTTFAQHAPAEPFGPFDYSRCGNPTRSHLERLVAGIENAQFAIAWASGMAAITGIMHLLKVGDEVLCISDVYGGTQRYFRNISAVNHELVFKFIDMDNLDNDFFEKNFSKKTKMIWLESPTNPNLKVTDIRAIVKATKEFNSDIIIAVDNTFMSPVNCTPLDLGVDIVMESATKFLGGHSDLVMGITATNNKIINERLYFISKSLGGVPSPFDCYMLIRGIKTLVIRVEKQNKNAMEIALFLETHKKVENVLYPGLETSEYHLLAKSQQKGFGAVVSFVIKGGLAESRTFLKALKVFILAESLGSVESLAELPGLMTHFSVPPEIRNQLGIHNGLIRLAVGIENVEDLIKDLDQALSLI
jgi:cystathionine gamma-lyase